LTDLISGQILWINYKQRECAPSLSWSKI